MMPFIVFEGLACSGKSTQAKRLTEWFLSRGVPARLNVEPTKGPIGALVRKLIHGGGASGDDINKALELIATYGMEQDVAADAVGIFQKLDEDVPLLEMDRQMLFMLDRRDDVRGAIRSARSTGKIVVQDRYELSTFSHGIVQDIGWRELRAMQKKVLGDSYETPSLTFFIDVSPEVALARLEKRGEVAIYDAKEEMENIRANYFEIMQALSREGYGPIVKVNGEQTEDEVFEEIKLLLWTILRIR